MKVAAVPAQAIASFADLRRVRPAVRTTSATDLGTQLPCVIADRLAGLMAQDPGLAEAVSARLPAARADSARDLAAYALAAPERTIDIRS